MIYDFRESAKLQIPIGAFHVNHFANTFRALEKFPQIAVWPVKKTQPFAIGGRRFNRLRHLQLSPDSW